MKQLRRQLWFALLGLVLAAGPAWATSFVRVSDAALVDQAPLVIAGRIGEKSVHDQENRPVTDYPVTVLEVLKGRVPETQLTLRIPGGIRADGSGLYLYGAPKFEPGEEALLFLARAPDGSYRPVQWSLGVFHRGRDGQGRALALRDLSELREIRLPGRPEPPGGLRDFEKFKDWLRQRGRGLHPQPDYRSLPAADTLESITAPYTFFT